MAIYVKRTCPNCKYIFDNWALNYKMLGCPITICPRCKIAIRNEHINEWELITLYKKVEFFIALLYTSLVLSLFSILLMYLLAKIGYEDFFWYQKAPTINVAIILAIITIIIFLFRVNKFLKNIKESNTRMKDAKYRKYLQSYGVIDVLPSSSICSFCNSEVELDLSERIAHKYICPECSKLNNKFLK